MTEGNHKAVISCSLIYVRVTTLVTKANKIKPRDETVRCGKATKTTQETELEEVIHYKIDVL